MTEKPYDFGNIDFIGSVTRKDLRAINLFMRESVEEGEKCSWCGQSNRASAGLDFCYKVVDGVIQSIPTKWKKFSNTFQQVSFFGLILAFIVLEKVRHADGEGFSSYWGQVLRAMYSLW